jgi:GxxExxY protein
MDEKEKYPEKELTQRIIAAAIEVHRELGPGYLEAIYEEALAREFASANIPFERQKQIAVKYKGSEIGKHRLDFLVDEKVVVEIKAVERFDEVHRAQVISYCKAFGVPVGLLMNFNVPVLKNGIRRIIYSNL